MLDGKTVVPVDDDGVRGDVELEMSDEDAYPVEEDTLCGCVLELAVPDEEIAPPVDEEGIVELAPPDDDVAPPVDDETVEGSVAVQSGGNLVEFVHTPVGRPFTQTCGPLGHVY